jgi:hypothetical protein
MLALTVLIGSARTLFAVSPLAHVLPGEMLARLVSGALLILGYVVLLVAGYRAIRIVRPPVLALEALAGILVANLVFIILQVLEWRSFPRPITFTAIFTPEVACLVGALVQYLQVRLSGGLQEEARRVALAGQQDVDVRQAKAENARANDHF